MSLRTYAPAFLVLMLACAAMLVWHAVFAHGPSGELTVAFLNVGQGDALYIESPNGTRTLIDGGKGRAVLPELGALIPFGERKIDVVIATHPDLDHIGGLPDVFKRYEVGMFIESGVPDDGADAEALHQAVTDEGLTPVLAREGMTLMLDKGVVLTILFPDRDVSGMEANMGSIVARLTYGDTSFLFTGDSPIAIEEYLASRYGEALASDVLKLGHHGSKTSTGDMLLGYVSPAYAVISAGCDNSYGHPHADVLERLARFKVAMIQTCEQGTAVFTSDGSTVSVRE